jgi:hypothetical protein
VSPLSITQFLFRSLYRADALFVGSFYSVERNVFASFFSSLSTFSNRSNKLFGILSTVGRFENTLRILSVF